MPTNLPQQPPAEFAVIHLLALPLLFLVLSTLVEFPQPVGDAFVRCLHEIG